MVLTMKTKTKTKRSKKFSSTVDASIPLYNISIFGAGSVGKSALIQRILDDRFHHEHVPTISEMYRIPLQRETKTVAHFSVCDTAGSIAFPAMRRLTIAKSDACMIVYSVDSRDSFLAARILVAEMLQIRGENFPCVLVANKSDVTEREVTFESGLRCAVEYGMSYVETSAKDDTNVTTSFDSVLTKIEKVSLKELLRSRRQSALNDFHQPLSSSASTPSSTPVQSKRKTSSWTKLKRSNSSGMIL